jgi:hypothetical protein
MKNRTFDSLHGRYMAGLVTTVTLFAALLSCAAIPPITDLPQHLAQIRLFNELIGLEATVFDRSGYQINWFAPNTLVYFPLWLLELVFDSVNAGRLAMFLLAIGWASSIFHLSKVRGRPLAHAMLACVFILNLSFYWGFINFLFAFPLFILWVVRITKEKIVVRNPAWLVLNFVFLSMIMWCHSLWFLMAAVWYGGYIAYLNYKKEISLKSALILSIPVIPLAIFSLIWVPELRASLIAAGYRVIPIWNSMPLDRLTISALSNHFLGGLQGPIENSVVLICMVWMALCVYTHRDNLLESIDKKIGSCALLFWALYLFAPDFYMNTMLFSQRWAAPAIIFSILALPTPKLQKEVNTIPMVVFVTFLIASSLVWKSFDDTEMTGIEDSLAQVPNNQRVLWLSFEQSPRFKTPPFLQIGAWNQAQAGSEVNFSFAELGTGIVVTKGRRQSPWTRNLEWYPTLVTQEDLNHFDYVLVNGRAAVHQAFVEKYNVTPIDRVQRFRLYKL